MSYPKVNFNIVQSRPSDIAKATGQAVQRSLSAPVLVVRSACFSVIA